MALVCRRNSTRPRNAEARTLRVQPALRPDIAAWANPYLAVRRAASAHSLSFPYAEKDFVLLVAVYSQPYGLASNRERFFFSRDRS
jgi:hypothetical protein